MIISGDLLLYCVLFAIGYFIIILVLKYNLEFRGYKRLMVKKSFRVKDEEYLRIKYNIKFFLFVLYYIPFIFIYENIYTIY